VPGWTRVVFDGVCVAVDGGCDAGRQQDRQHGAFPFPWRQSGVQHDCRSKSRVARCGFPVTTQPGYTLFRQVIGGPAFVSGKLHKGDEILKVDGADCSSVEDLRKGLKGSDLPGSCVVLTIKKLRSVIFNSPHVTDASQLASPSLQFFATFFYATCTHVSQYDYLQNIFKCVYVLPAAGKHRRCTTGARCVRGHRRQTYVCKIFLFWSRAGCALAFRVLHALLCTS
jgi:hypothetical protein